MANINLNQRYGVAAAENGKFAPIDMSSLTPSYSGDGRFAILTYQINAAPISLSGDISIAQQTPNTTIYETLEIPSATPTSLINFSPTITLLEMYNNNDTEPIYLSFNNNNVSANGLPITAGSFYSIERETSSIYVSNPSNINVDVRIIGHYKV